MLAVARSKCAWYGTLGVTLTSYSITVIVAVLIFLLLLLRLLLLLGLLLLLIFSYLTPQPVVENEKNRYDSRCDYTFSVSFLSVHFCRQRPLQR